MNNNENLGIDDAIVEDALYGILTGEWSVEDTALESARVKTFAEDGVMNYNKGLVITLSDGTAFQLTIVQSR